MYHFTNLTVYEENRLSPVRKKPSHQSLGFFLLFTLILPIKHAQQPSAIFSCKRFSLHLLKPKQI